MKRMMAVLGDGPGDDGLPADWHYSAFSGDDGWGSVYYWTHTNYLIAAKGGKWWVMRRAGAGKIIRVSGPYPEVVGAIVACKILVAAGR